MNSEELKKIISSIENKEVSLEDLLLKNDFILGPIKTKFVKFQKFFTKEWVEKLIDIAFSFKSKDFQKLSHNSTEILATIRHNSLLKTFLCKDGDSYPLLNKFFGYLNFVQEMTKSIKRKKTSEVFVCEICGNESEKGCCEFSWEMLSGYFERIFFNLIIKKKRKVNF